MNLGLENKPVVVCASSAGLGKATAMECARDGARVMLCGRYAESLNRAASEIEVETGTEAKYTVADLTKPADIAHLIERTVSLLGGIFALVNNSGGPPAGGFEQFDDAAGKLHLS
jgi:3-oxoacyl-[acyl-carrier protein] reductase